MAEAEAGVKTELMVCEGEDTSLSVEETEHEAPEGAVEEATPEASIEVAETQGVPDNKRKLEDLVPLNNDEAPAKKQQICGSEPSTESSEPNTEGLAPTEDKVIAAVEVAAPEVGTEETEGYGHPIMENPVVVADDTIPDSALGGPAIDGNLEEQLRQVEEPVGTGIFHAKVEEESLGNGQISSTDDIQHASAEDTQHPSSDSLQDGLPLPISYDLSNSTQKIDVPNDKVWPENNHPHYGFGTMCNIGGTPWVRWGKDSPTITFPAEIPAFASGDEKFGRHALELGYALQCEQDARLAASALTDSLVKLACMRTVASLQMTTILGNHAYQLAESLKHESRGRTSAEQSLIELSAKVATLEGHLQHANDDLILAKIRMEEKAKELAASQMALTAARESTLEKEKENADLKGTIETMEKEKLAWRSSKSLRDEVAREIGTGPEYIQSIRETFEDGIRSTRRLMVSKGLIKDEDYDSDDCIDDVIRAEAKAEGVLSSDDDVDIGSS